MVYLLQQRLVKILDENFISCFALVHFVGTVLAAGIDSAGIISTSVVNITAFQNRRADA
jgi:hypothetical protein